MINIQDIIPFMKKGWVAMDEDGEWYWYEKEPRMFEMAWSRECELTSLSAICFKKIKKVKNWEKSLIKVGGKDDWTKSLIRIDHISQEGKKVGGK